MHRHQACEGFNAVPKVLDADVLVFGMLIIVVIGDRHGDGGDAVERFADDGQWKAAA